MWEKGDECGELRRAQGTFSVFEIKNKEEDPREKKKKPTQKFSAAVGVFYWGLAKGKKIRLKIPFRRSWCGVLSL